MSGREISTCTQLGWTELKNGDLLSLAESEGFEVMITADQNFRYQQNLSKHRISLIVLGSNDWTVGKNFIHAIRACVESCQQNGYVFIEMPPGRRKRNE